MHYKRQIRRFFSVACTIVLALPLLNIFTTATKEKPTLFLSDPKRLFSTDPIESIVNYSLYRFLGLSADESKAVVGKDGYLFLGNGFGQVIDKTRGVYAYTDADVKRWLERISKLRAWYRSRGIAFLFVVAPNKHSVYDDKLPRYIRYAEGRTLTDTLEKVTRAQDIPLLNLTETLRAKKNDASLFFRTDTHWNAYGAYLGYLATIRTLNRLYDTRIPILSCRAEPLTVYGAGDLARQLKIDTFLDRFREREYRFFCDGNRSKRIKRGRISNAGGMIPYGPRKKAYFNQFSYNPDAAVNAKLLYICDSFGLANTSFYEQTFSTVWRLHLDYLHGKRLADFLLEHTPDIVVYQVVERDLGNNAALNDLPPPDMPYRSATN